MTEASIEGVDVDTRHWIGGRRVASADDLHRRLADRRAADRRGRPRAAQPRSTPPWPRPGRRSRPGPRRRAERARRRAAPRSPTGSTRGPRTWPRVETRDNGSLLRSHRRSVMPRVGHELPLLRRLAASSWPGRTCEIRGHRERVTWDPAGVAAVITPVERPADAGDLADRSGAGGRQHRRGQAARVGAADRVACSPTSRDEAGLPRRRVQRRPGHRAPRPAHR